MGFTVATTTGSTVTIDNGTKITSIAGKSCDLLLVGASAEDTAGRRRGRVLSRTPVVLQTFSQVNPSTLAFEYNSAVTVLAQTEEIMMGRWDIAGDRKLYGTPEAPRSEVDIYLNNADATQDFGIIFAKALDPARGIMAPGLWTVQLIPTPTVTAAGNALLGIPDTVTAGSASALSPLLVDLSEQFKGEENNRVKAGDAKIIIPRTTSYTTLATPGIFIDITPLGGSALRYQLWGSDGIEAMDTYHWCVYLKRCRP